MALAERRSQVKRIREAVDRFVIAKNIKELQANGYRLKVIRASRSSWSAERLKELVPKGLWLQITKQTPDPGLIDAAVKAGKLDGDVIKAAFVSTPNAPYVRRFEDKVDDAEDEAERVRAAMTDAYMGRA